MESIDNNVTITKTNDMLILSTNTESHTIDSVYDYTYMNNETYVNDKFFIFKRRMARLIYMIR